MSLVNKDDMTTLRSASEAAATAKTAEEDQQLLAVAFAINHASNTGLYRVVYQSKLLDATVQALESNGYTIKYFGDAYDAERQAIISWQV